MKFLIVFGLLCSSLVQATELKIFSKSSYEVLPGWGTQERIEYNKELGRAWVEISVNFDAESSGDTYRVKVDGLKFDKENQVVVYEKDNQRFVCGQLIVKGRGIFKREVYKATKHCLLEERWRKYTYDDGFQIRKGERFEVFLITP